MASVGGSIEEVSVAGRLFGVASDADVARKLGGFENEVQSNGNATARDIKTRVPWSLTGLQIDIDEDRNDQQFLQGIADGNEFVDITITYASRVTYNGLGTITDTLEFSNTSATAGVSFMGQGTLTKQ